MAYIAGTGDTVPEALRTLGIGVDMLAPSALPSTDLRPYTAVMLGVRTYTAAPGLAEGSPALRRYAEAGGTVVVQYQSADFPGLPYPVHLGSSPAKVVEAPQAGGLRVAPGGKGRYVYLALALYRQLPEGVEGAYRLLGNLASGKAG